MRENKAAMSAHKATALWRNRNMTFGSFFCNGGPVSSALFKDFPWNSAAESNTTLNFPVASDLLTTPPDFTERLIPNKEERWIPNKGKRCLPIHLNIGKKDTRSSRRQVAVSN